MTGSEDQVVLEADDLGRGDLHQVLPIDDCAGRVVDAEDDGVGRDVEPVALVLSPGQPVDRGHARGDAPDAVVRVGRGGGPDDVAGLPVDAGELLRCVEHVDVGADRVGPVDVAIDRRLPGDPPTELASGRRAERVEAIEFLAPRLEPLLPRGVVLGDGKGGEHARDQGGGEHVSVKRRCGHVWYGSG